MTRRAPGTHGEAPRLASVAAVVVSAVMPPFLVAALTPHIANDLRFDSGDLGAALACCYTVTAVVSPWAGRFVERSGPVQVLLLAAGATTTALVIAATATRAGDLVIALAVAGLSSALTQPASNALLADIEEPMSRAGSFGVVQASIPAASLLAGCLLAVGGRGADWRVLMLLVAATTALAPFSLRRALSAGGRACLRDEPGEEATETGGARLMAALVVTGCLASAAATALPAFTAMSALEVGVGVSVAAAAQVAGSLGSMLVRVTSPRLVGRSSLRRRLALVAVLQVTGLIGMTAVATGTTLGFVVGSTVAFAFGWGWNSLYNLVVATARPRGVASATGLTQCGVFLGGAVGPLAFSAVHQAHGDAHAWLTMAGIMAVAAVTAAVGSALADPGREAPSPERRHDHPEPHLTHGGEGP